MRLEEGFLSGLRRALPASRVHTDPADCWPYGGDNSRQFAPPDAVAFPASHEDVVAVARLCCEFGVPLMARGRATATTGAAVPVHGGVVLSFERMDRILRVDPANRLMVVEPGVTNGAVQRAASEAGFFWAPDPTSAEYCTVGGNIAVNAGGPRAVKYGATRENVLALRAVAGDGRELKTGSPTTKGATGYDLTRLLIGSEGTLAIVTEATLLLRPLPEAKRTLVFAYRDIRTATGAVVALMRSPWTPSMLEFMDAASLQLVRSQGVVPEGASVPASAQALLLVECDGPSMAMGWLVEQLVSAARNEGLIECAEGFAADADASLLAARKALSPLLRKLAPNKLNEDVVVPVARIPELISGLEALSREFGIPIVNFGHAGNGNIHVNLLFDTQDPAQARAARPCLERVFDLVLSLAGTLSGEHGIGLTKREWMPRAIPSDTLSLMRALKAVFDPRGILNPGKLFPE